MPDAAAPLRLISHPATPAAAVRALEAHAAWTRDGGLCLAYRLWGDIARLRIPADEPQRTADGLWEHSCFEAFVALPGNPVYREFNFSPSGLWASYDFADYRRRIDAVPARSAPQIATRRFAGRLEVDATIAAQALPAGGDALEIGLAAVIEAADVVDGSHSYWALAHCAERPDFHLRESFTLRLTRATC